MNNLFYLGNSYLEDQIPTELEARDPISLNASQQRERYLFSLFLKIKNVSKCTFISFGLGNTNGFFKNHTVLGANYKSVYLGYFGFGKLKLISGIFTAFWYLLGNVRSGDTIISYNVQPGYALAIIPIKLIKRIKYIIEFEDFYNRNDYRFYINRPFDRFCMYLANGFIASSHGMKLYLLNQHPSKPCAVHSGYRLPYNLSYFRKANNVKNNIQMKKLFYSGSLDLERGILDLISMFLARPNDQFELIITGYGSLKNIVEDYSERYKDIHYIGNLSEKRYVEVLDQSTICINSQIPSIYLNFPSKITHYLSHGKMVMSTKGASVIKSEFYPLIQFYNYSDITSFWNAVNKILSIDMNDILETRLHLFNKIFNEMDRRLIDYLEITTA